jgi:tetratricopeptide (TPR) repeat protein
MARRRLNLGFLAKFGLVVLLLACGGYAMLLFRKPRNPAPYITAGEDAYKAGNWEAAAANLSIASDLLPQRADLHLKLGDCYYQLRTTGSEHATQAVTEYTKAEELEPKNADAWIGLLKVNDYEVTQLEAHTKDARIRQQLAFELGVVRDAAEHLAVLKPDSVEAKSAGDILTLRLWILGLNIPMTAAEKALPVEKQPTPDHRAEQAIADLTKLMADHPEEEKIPYWIARGKIRQGQEAASSDHPENAAPLYAEAAAQFDSCISARPDVANLYLSKASVLSALSVIDTAPGSDYRRRLHDTLQIAQAKVDPVTAPDDYERAKQQWAGNLATPDANGVSDMTGAVDVLNKLIEKFPDHLNIRMQLAQLLKSRSRLDEALKVLDAIPTLVGPPVTDLNRRAAWEWMVNRARIMRADIEVDELSIITPGQKRDELVKDIRASLDEAGKQFIGTPTLLRVQGRFAVAMGEKREAIDKLTEAADKMSVDGGGPDYELLREEALAYASGGQAAKAVEILERAIVDPVLAKNAEIHLTLAQLNLQNHDYAKAQPFIDWLAERYPDRPEVVILEIQELGPTPAWVQVKDLFAKMPEKTPADLTLKSKIAMELKNSDESIRILDIMNKTDPGDVQPAITLAQVLKQANRMKEANDVMTEVIKRNPTNAMLVEVQRELNGNETREEMDAAEKIAIDKIPDPFTREKAFARFYRAQERPEEELVHLQKAVELQPNDKEMLSTLFFHYIDMRRFNDAQAMLPHIAELNVDDAGGLLYKCKLALAMNDVASAIVFGRQMTHDFPNFAGSWEMYGEALEASNQLNLAGEQYQTALGLQATNTDALTHLITCSVQQGKTAEAKHYIDDACKRFPSDPAYRDMRQRFEITNGNPESILAELDAQIQNYPEQTIGYGMDIQALQVCGVNKANQGDATAAADYQQRARERLKQAVARWPDNLLFANGLAQSYAQVNDVTNVEAVMKALMQRPRWKDRARPMVILGELYLSMQKYDLAETALKQALAIQHDAPEALLNLSDCKRYQGDPEGALVVLQPYVANPTIRARYTSQLLDMGRGQQAEMELSDALKAQPGDISLTNLMLEVLFFENKADRGIELANQTINSDRSNVYAYYWRARLYLLGNNPDPDRATKDLTQFLDAFPTDPQGHYMMARILDSKHNRDDAIQELISAMKSAPQDRSIRLYLLSDYLSSTPPRTGDAQRSLQEALAMPAFAHDAEFESQLALLQAQNGDKDAAVATMQKAMSDVKDKDKDALVPAYFRILVLTKSYDLLLTESDKRVTDPNKAGWLVFCDRGIAKAGLGDVPGAVTEFNTALDRAGTTPGRAAPLEVANAIAAADKLGPGKALELVLPRAKNSVLWQLIAIDLYITNHDIPGATKEADIALGSIDQLSAPDQMHLLEQASNLFINASPPMVDRALDMYHKRLALEPNDINALNDVACILIDMSVPPNPKEGLTYAKKAYDLSANNGQMQTRVADTYGWALIQSTKVSEGISVLHSAIDNSTGDQANFPDIHYHLAEAYLKINEVNSAEQELTSAMQAYQHMLDTHQVVDESLKAKIDKALNQASEMMRGKSDAKPASSGQ